MILIWAPFIGFHFLEIGQYICKPSNATSILLSAIKIKCMAADKIKPIDRGRAPKRFASIMLLSAII